LRTLGSLENSWVRKQVHDKSATSAKFKFKNSKMAGNAS
jgi:hypothetical protein